MTAANNLIDLASELFSYFGQLRDYINILATSRRNPIKNALIQYFRNSVHFYFPFDRFSCNELLLLLQFCPNVKHITLNQYQRDSIQASILGSEEADEKIHIYTECKDDLVHFLDLFAAKCPKLSKQVVTIRLFTLFWDKEYEQHYCRGTLIPIASYSKHLIPTEASDPEFDASLKYPRLKCFISNGDWHNRITPKHVEYISKESHSLHVIDIHNMVPTNNPNDPNSRRKRTPTQTTVFKQIFAKHRDLTFLRVRISQTFECALAPSIATADFEGAHLDKLKILMIQNSAAFDWTWDFVKSLMDKLNPNAFRFLYLTWEGSRESLRFGGFDRMREQFQSKFEALFQKKDFRDKWHLLMEYLADGNKLFK